MRSSVTENHLTDWDNVKVINRESDRCGKQIREAIWRPVTSIKMTGATNWAMYGTYWRQKIEVGPDKDRTWEVNSKRR